ncbi:MAG: sulfatase [Flavobacteriaceae bacterium]|nr:sulfatase [Flavobacteriaceae bacterium]
MKNYILLIAYLMISLGNSLQSQNDKPNILLITLDDMNWDSPASFGGVIPDLTPNIDAIAKDGVLFKNAYVQAPNCSPSRVVIQTGLYPHQSGMRGFYYVKDNINTLPEILKDNGYFTGVINKAADTNLGPNASEYWNYNKSPKSKDKRNAKMYASLLSDFLKKKDTKKKPFYCVVNIADPHKPFFNDKQSQKNGFDEFAPSKIYTLNDVKIPEFLPKSKKIKQEILNYYNSVKRGDDCVGEIMHVLKETNELENTVVILLSDHGMPLPFAKSTVYQNGIKTPLVISYKKKFTPRTDDNSLVSAIDLAPTILDITDLNIPKKMQGQSFLQVLTDANKQQGEFVFAQFDENAGGVPRPSRAVINKKYGYVFNPWATGMFKFQSASSWHTSYKEMQKLAKIDTKIKDRFEFWKYRSIEELYDYENDPNALNNLINDPNYKDVVDKLRNQLNSQMMATKDYVLNAFENKNDKRFLNNWMQQQEKEAENRRKTIKWKREKNTSGSAKNNTELFQ